MLSRFRSYVRQHHLAMLALFVALGGTAYAAQLHGNDIINRTIPREKLRINTLTGREIHEPALKVLQNLEVVTQESRLNSNSPKQVIVSCPIPKFAVGGGGEVVGSGGSSSAPPDVAIAATRPLKSGFTGAWAAWTVRATETGPTNVNWRLSAQVFCARIPE